MKTVKQVAAENCVSTQTVYKRLKHLPDELKDGVVKGDNRKTLISPEAEAFIVNGLNQADKAVDKNDFKPVDSSTLQVYRKLTETLQEQLKVKDEQIAELHSEIKNLQLLMLADKKIKRLPEPAEEGEPARKPAGFFNRLFNRTKEQ